MGMGRAEYCAWPSASLPTWLASGTLRKTPLNGVHREMGARMVPFGGWDMPVEYAGLIAEHLAVRQAAGLFDVSHMGEFEVEGPGAMAFLQRVMAFQYQSAISFSATFRASASWSVICRPPPACPP